jgi:acetyl esterase
MVVGSDDILLEDNLTMAARMSAARVDIHLHVYPASPHGFTGHPTRMAREALDRIETWLRDRLDQ